MIFFYGFAQMGSWMDSAGTWTFWGFRDRKLRSGENLWSFSYQGGESSNNYVVRISFRHLLDTLLSKKSVTCGVWHKNQLGKKCHALKQALGGEPAKLLCPWDFPGKNAGVGCHFFLRGIFPTQKLNSSLLHCRWILYCWATGEAHKYA